MVGAGAFGVYRALNPPRVGGISLAQLPAPEQQKRREEARQLTKQVGEVAKAVRAQTRQPFQIVATEEQLNTLLQDNLKTQNLPINNVRLGLQPGQIVLQGDGEYKGFNAPATLVGTLEAVNGGVQFKVQSLTVGGFPAPEQWRTKIENAVGGNLKKFFQSGSSGRIEKVAIEAGRMTVSGLSG